MTLSLSDLGWSQHFQEQVETAEFVGRVDEVHRDRIIVRTPDAQVALTTGSRSTGEIAIGDWVQFDTNGHSLLTVLDRRSALRRKAPGHAGGEQLIAANVDTLFIVTSCNADFNRARLERYIALALSGNIEPIIVLTKSDLSDNAETLRQQAEALSPNITAIAVNALQGTSLDQLLAWLGMGKTSVLVGSSGVGKSTILNALTDGQVATQGIREDDAKGRHTTTARSLRRAGSGGWLIDTPGIRELALVDSAEAIDAVFSDIIDLIGQCRFSDCAHDAEPGCAVRDAIDAGSLDPDRLARWRKLHIEDRENSETAKETRLRKKAASKQARTGGKRGSKK